MLLGDDCFASTHTQSLVEQHDQQDTQMTNKDTQMRANRITTSALNTFVVDESLFVLVIKSGGTNDL